MNAFDIIGPVMIGPSSSHTAGAARIGKVARMILGEEPVDAHILLHGSFAKTFRGHGTDRALAGGLMGYEVDDVRIRDSLLLAEQQGLKISFEACDLGKLHPNTAVIEVKGASGKSVSVTGSSVGGGNIAISEIDGIDVEFSGEYHTLVASYTDMPGVIAAVTDILASGNINIAFMKVFRTMKRGRAIMVIEADQPVGDESLARVRQIPRVSYAIIINPVTGG